MRCYWSLTSITVGTNLGLYCRQANLKWFPYGGGYESSEDLTCQSFPRIFAGDRLIKIRMDILCKIQKVSIDWKCEELGAPIN